MCKQFLYYVSIDDVHITLPRFRVRESVCIMSTKMQNESDTVSSPPTPPLSEATKPDTRPQDNDHQGKSLLVDVPVDSHNAALNLMIAFLSVAQKRGTFNMQESAKLWECINQFTGPQDPPPSQQTDKSVGSDTTL